VSAALIGGMVAAVATLIVAMLTFYGSRLHRRETKEDQADAVVSKYREPLARAAFELQQRLYNILQGDFLRVYHKEREATRHYAETSTLWLIGQLFGWMEILRREIQFLDLGNIEKNQLLERLLLEVRRITASDTIYEDSHRKLVDKFVVFRSDQRAIGELMIVERVESKDERRTDCMGYAQFASKLESDANFQNWFAQLRKDVADTAADGRSSLRLNLLQHALIDLIEFLDDDRSRFPLDERGKVLMTVPSTDSVRRLVEQRVPQRATKRYARFRRAGNIYPVLDAWAGCAGYSMASEDTADDIVSRSYEKSLLVSGVRSPLLGVKSVVDVKRYGIWIEISGHVLWPNWPPRDTQRHPAIRLPLDSGGWWFSRARRSARHSVNLLLEVFGRPKIR